MDLRTQEILILAVSALTVLAIFLLYRNRDRLLAWIDWLSQFFGAEPAADADVNWRLFWISFAGLYVEIMLIRWLGTEVRVFAYFQNLALIACFLGFGLGCYWAERRKGLVFSLLAIVGLVTLVKLPSHTWQVFLTVLSTRLSFSADAAIWSYSYEAGLGTTYWVVLLLAAVLAVTAFLLLLVVIMIPLGQWVGCLLYTSDAADE